MKFKVMIIFLLFLLIYYIPCMASTDNEQYCRTEEFSDVQWVDYSNEFSTTVTYKLTYKEYFTYNSSNKKFTYDTRTISALWKSTAGGSSISLLSVRHVKDGSETYFTPWEKQDVMYSSEWEGCTMYKNTTSVTYPYNCDVVCWINYYVNCGNSVPKGVNFELLSGSQYK